jgi:hypothetical protein
MGVVVPMMHLAPPLYNVGTVRAGAVGGCRSRAVLAAAAGGAAAAKGRARAAAA